MKMMLAVVGLFIVLFPFRDNIYSWLAEPLSRFLPEGTEMIAYEVASPFFIPFKLALMLSVFLAIPFLLYQIWAFIAPGLYSHEKRLVAPLLASSTLLFYAGCAFAYFVVFPLVFKFFINVAPEGVQVSPDIARYLDFVITLFFAFGIAFEVPIATVLLVITGITTPENLKKMRPYVFVGAFVIGMFLTPPDIISQTLLAVPMWLLFEVGIVFSGYIKVRAKEATEASTAKTEAEAEEAEADAAKTMALQAEKDEAASTADESVADSKSSSTNDGDENKAGRTPDVPGGYRNSLTDYDGTDESER